MNIIGLDLYKRESQLCVLTEAGEIIESGVLDDGCWVGWLALVDDLVMPALVVGRAHLPRDP